MSTATPAYDTKDKKVEDVKKNRVRIKLTCQNLKSVERVANELIKRAKTIQDVKVTGPVRLPIKKLKMTVRKSPCGEGTNTYDRYELRIYKRVLDLVCTTEDIKEITTIKIDPGVEVELTMKSEEEGGSN